MTNFIRIGIIVCCFLLSNGILIFAQRNDVQDISTPELSKMFKDHDGLFSSSDMQAYQEDKSSQSDMNKKGNIYWKSKKAKDSKSVKSSEPTSGK